MRGRGALLVVLAACGAAEPKPVPPANRTGESSAVAPADAGVDGPPPCVAACVAAHQMQATSVDVITGRCEQDCAAGR